MFNRFLLFLVLFIYSSFSYSIKLNNVRSNEELNNFYILFIIVKTGDFTCISEYLNQTKFQSNIKVRSISLDTLRIKGNQSLLPYEQILKDKLNGEHYDFIVILDEFRSLSNEFYKFINSNYKNNSLIVSYCSDSDVHLSLQFNRFFSFLKELNDKPYNIHYLYNSNSKMNNHYFGLLGSNNYGLQLNVVKHQVTYKQEVTHLLNTLIKDSSNVIISNLDYIIDDITGDLLELSELTSEFSFYSAHNMFLSITHNICRPLNTQFVISWDFKVVTDTIDEFISQKQQHLDFFKQVVSSEFIINFSLKNGVLKDYDVNKLEHLLEYTDHVYYIRQ